MNLHRLETSDLSIKRPNTFGISLKPFFLIVTTILFINGIVSTLLAGEPEKGRIIGKLVDKETGEPLIGANILLEGTDLGASTDIDGVFAIRNISPGTYNLTIIHISYQETQITNLEIKAGKASRLELAMKTKTITTDEIIIEAKLLENSNAAMLKKRQRAVSISDAVSAEQFSKTGSGDAAEAMKQMVGASVVEGKYVYVRGLGGRYSTTQLNGMELPSSDPEKKAFQLDLLPTNLLDNIITLKTFTPDKPGSFSGGIVDVGTKNFPEALTIKISHSSSYNTQANLNDYFLTYPGGKQDWLATDDGTRALPQILQDGTITAKDLPDSRTEARQNPASAIASKYVGRAFGSVMDTKKQSMPVNQNSSFSIGNQTSIGATSSIGYLASLTYGRSFSFYSDGEVGIYTGAEQGSSELVPQMVLSDSRGDEQANIGSLAALSYNITPKQQVSGIFFYSRNGISFARVQQGHWKDGLGTLDEVAHNRILGYSERDISSVQLYGKHLIGALFNTTIDWKASQSSTLQDEPDRRMIFFTVDTTATQSADRYNIQTSNIDKPRRYFRKLQDHSINANINLSIPFSQWSNLAGKFKFGGAYQASDRDFNERIFEYNPDNRIFNQLNGDLNAFFGEAGLNYQLDPTATGGISGNFIREASEKRNNYIGNQFIRAAYGMIDLPLTHRLRLIGGLRYETTHMNVTSEDKNQNTRELKKQDLLPSINLIYALTDKINFRAAATKTLARPNFRELAPYSSKNFIGGDVFEGNPLLERTLINNYDLRWEYFIRPGEIFAISGFYKNLSNPIESTFKKGTTQANRIITLENVENAQISGVEIESRIRLDLLSSRLENFSIGGNISFVHSNVDVAAEELANRKSSDSTASNTRQLQGQSPFIVNLDLAYNNYDWGSIAMLHFNVFGERLSKVSRESTPDIFEQSLSQLDFLASQQLLDNFSIKLSIKNILNRDFKYIYRFKGQETIYQKYTRGITYSFGISYHL